MAAEPSVNLTLETQIVRPVSDVNPVPGCDLVVFEKVPPDGHRFRKVLGPDETMRSRWISRVFGPGGFAAYAVTRDDDVRHEFSREVTTWDQAGTFVLRCALTLRVVDPRAIVEQLARDPLKRLEEEAGHLFHKAAACIEWTKIENLGIAFERQVLESESTDAAGNRAPNLVLLRAFAARRGFELQNVDLSVIFSVEFGELVRVQRQEDLQRKLLEMKAMREELEVRLQHGLERERSKLLQMQTAQERLRSLIDSTGGNLERILTNIADGVSTPAALRGIMVELRDTLGQMSDMVAHGAIAAANAPAVARERLAARLPEGGAGDVEPSIRHLDEIVKLNREISCDEDLKRRLLSAALHLLGELALDRMADAGALDGCRAALRAGFEAVLPALKTQRQHEVLIDLLSLKSSSAGPTRVQP
jgi:hypothetical protein